MRAPHPKEVTNMSMTQFIDVLTDEEEDELTPEEIAFYNEDEIEDY